MYTFSAFPTSKLYGTVSLGITLQKILELLSWNNVITQGIHFVGIKKVKLAFCMGKLRSKVAQNRGISATHTCTTYCRRNAPLGFHNCAHAGQEHNLKHTSTCPLDRYPKKLPSLLQKLTRPKSLISQQYAEWCVVGEMFNIERQEMYSKSLHDLYAHSQN